MKNITAELNTELASEVTTLCGCWAIRRVDGQLLGFTDHDQDLIIDGLTYVAETGFLRSAISNTATAAPGELNVQGLLTDDNRLTEHDLRAGLYDYAHVELFVVNWANLSQGKLQLRYGNFGEVTITSTGQFTIELRGLLQRLEQQFIEIYGPTCRASLGDARCKIKLYPDPRISNKFYSAGDRVFLPAVNGDTPAPIVEGVTPANNNFASSLAGSISGWALTNMVGTGDSLRPTDWVSSAVQTVDLTSPLGSIITPAAGTQLTFSTTSVLTTFRSIYQLSRLYVEFLDASMVSLGNDATPYTNSATHTLNASLPAGVRYVTFKIQTTKYDDLQNPAGTPFSANDALLFASVKTSMGTLVNNSGANDGSTVGVTGGGGLGGSGSSITSTGSYGLGGGGSSVTSTGEVGLGGAPVPIAVNPTFQRLGSTVTPTNWTPYPYPTAANYLQSVNTYFNTVAPDIGGYFATLQPLSTTYGQEVRFSSDAIDLTSGDISTDQLDTGTYNCTINWKGVCIDTSSSVGVGVAFFNALGHLINSDAVTYENLTPLGIWQSAATNFAVPPGARSLKIIIGFKPVSSASNYSLTYAGITDITGTIMSTAALPVLTPETFNGVEYVAANSGTTAATAPIGWSTTIGDTIVDGGVTWIVSQPKYLYVGTVSAVTSRGKLHLSIPGPALPDDRLQWGVLKMLDGDAAGFSRDIVLHKSGVVTLNEPLFYTPHVGDHAFVSTGCDKTIKTCHEKFNNEINMRGYPYMPGTDQYFQVGIPFGG